MERDKRERGRPLTPSPIIEQLGGVIDTPEKAEEFFKIFFTTDWQPRNPTTGRKLERGRSTTFIELSRLRWEYPEILRKVLAGLNAYEWVINAWFSGPRWPSK
jgi:hypothetical protein